MNYREKNGIKYTMEDISEYNKNLEKEYISNFNNSHYTDIVKLTLEEDRELCNMFIEGCPLKSDILFAKTIPIKDMKIICDETNFMNGIGHKGQWVHEYRIKIFDNYEKIIDAIIENQSAGIVGITEISLPIGKTKFLLSVKYGLEVIVVSLSPYNTNNVISNVRMLSEIGKYEEFMYNTINEFLTTWYSIEIALLHPKVKELFSHPKQIKYLEKEKQQKQRKRKAKYVKYHILNKDDIEDRLYVNKHKKQCLCWYVIGHWRHFKNGNKVFVQGYWKGALRDTKKNYDNGRERIVEI